MLARIIKSDLEAGDYELVVAVPKGHWFYTKQFETCVNFKLAIQYTSVDKDADTQIIAVYPSSVKEMS